MKKFVVLTENELSQVSGGVDTKELIKETAIKAAVDKLIFGTVMLFIAPFASELSKRLVNRILGEPKKEEEKESKEVAQAA